MKDRLECPDCGSTQLTANKRGYNAGKALGGAILTGGIGLLAGFHGSKKIIITCLTCGHEFKPKKKKEEKRNSIPSFAPANQNEIKPLSESRKRRIRKRNIQNSIGGTIFLLLLLGIIYFIFSNIF